MLLSLQRFKMKMRRKTKKKTPSMTTLPFSPLFKAGRSGKNEEEEHALAILKVHVTCGLNNDQTCMMTSKLIQEK